MSYDEREDDDGDGGDTATMPGEQERKIGHSIEYLLIFFRCCPTNLFHSFVLPLSLSPCRFESIVIGELSLVFLDIRMYTIEQTTPRPLL